MTGTAFAQAILDENVFQRGGMFRGIRESLLCCCMMISCLVPTAARAESSRSISPDLISEIKEFLIARGVAPQELFAEAGTGSEPVYSCGPGDLNSDGRIDGRDLAVILSGFGCIAEPPSQEPPVCP